MNSLIEIRNLYTPIQPTISPADDDVEYLEILPSYELQEFIFCYWQLKTKTPLKEQFVYRVVADGCIDIFFELNNPTENFVMGFCKKYTEFPLDNSFNYVGIRFLPTMFPQIFNINAAEISNRFEKLSLILPETSRFLSKNFDIKQTLNTIKDKFDNYFINVLSKVEIDVDSRFYEALNIIYKNYGMINIEKDLNTGISPRQLRRLFEYYIGDSTKTFSKVVRFQNILKAKPSTQSLRENKLFYDTGYFDQAHFIKDFKNFYGVTPGKVFGR